MSSYKYYDTPEGEDFLQKTYYVCKNIGLYSASYGMYDVGFFTRPKSYLSAVDRFCRLALPPIGAGVIFCATVYIVTNVRKKDTWQNHLLGSYVGALFIRGCAKKLPFFWFCAAPVMVTIATIKQSRLEGYSPFAGDELDINENKMYEAVDWLRTPKSLYGYDNYLTADKYH